MKHLYKFKSFEEARENTTRDFIKGIFDIKKIKQFFANFHGTSQNDYKPGIYRFKSFEEARNYDMQMMITNSVARKKR